jgi:hypothetical protein
MFLTSVSSICSDPEKRVEQLAAHAARMRDKASKRQEKAATLISKSNEHNAEADRALRVAEKVKAILD